MGTPYIKWTYTCLCACSDNDSDNVDFIIVHQNEHLKNQPNTVTDHSFSSLSIKPEYYNLGVNFVNSLNKETIKVNVRKLDTIIKESDIKNIDILTVDVEGWELEVMKGLSLIKPKIVILENISHNISYNQYMEYFGYELDINMDINYIYRLKSI